MAKPSVPAFMTKFTVKGETLLIDLAAPRTVLSSAPRGGGLVRAQYIVNHQVPANPIPLPLSISKQKWEEPSRYLRRVAARVGVEAPSVGLMTAVPMKQLIIMREESAGVWVEGFFTVGVSNAVKAGEPVDAWKMKKPQSTVGTINIIVITNARLTSSAMVGAVQVVTESKTCALLAQRIRSHTGRSGATGTGTDAVVVAGGNGLLMRYSGTHTKFGEMLGRLVERGVLKGLLRSKDRGRCLSTSSLR